MSIKNFDDLLKLAKSDPLSQRLLFLFAKATPMEMSFKADHKSGTITPVMCVDKLPSELTDFKSLISEADSINTNWDFILMAGLSGANGVAPTSLEAGPHLSKMSNFLANGGDLSRYAIFDREEQIVVTS